MDEEDMLRRSRSCRQKRREAVSAVHVAGWSLSQILLTQTLQNLNQRTECTPTVNSCLLLNLSHPATARHAHK